MASSENTGYIIGAGKIWNGRVFYIGTVASIASIITNSPDVFGVKSGAALWRFTAVSSTTT